MADSEARWAPFAWFLMRSTGLPFEWAETFGDAPLWTEGLDEDAALAVARKALHAIASEPLFREAVALSNPGVGDLLDHWLDSLGADRRDSKARRRERTLMRYAQRMCGKNDATSYFGGVTVGRLDKVEPASTVRPTWATRHVYVTQWIAQQLLELAARDLDAAGRLVEYPRRAPGTTTAAEGALWQLRDGLIAIAAGRSALDAALLERADGVRSAAALAADVALAAGVGEDEVLPAIPALQEAGLLLAWSALPAGLEHPVDACLERLRQQPEGPERDAWIARFADLERARAEFEAAPAAARRALFAGLEERLEAATGEVPRHKAGEFYASRLVLHELCDRTGGAIGLPDGWAERLADGVGAYLELGAIELAEERLKLRSWFDRSYGDAAGPLPWREVFPKLRADRVGYELAAPPEARALAGLTRRLKERLRELVDAHLSQHGADVPLAIPRAEVDALLAEARPLIDQSGRGFCNPDLMVAARADGTMQPILSEAHHLPFITNCFIAPVADREAVLADTARFLAELCAPGRPGLVASHQLSFISVTLNIGEIALELSGASPRPPAQRASFADLQVARRGDGFVVTVATHTGEVVEVVPLTRLLRLDRVASAFAVPSVALAEYLGRSWRPAGQLPRIAWGDVVVHRRRWEAPADVWADGRTPRECALRLRRHCGDGLPRFTFASPGSEPKPLMFDWANPLSVEMAVAKAKEEGSLTLVEMLPGPDELWLRGPFGRHTSELRTVFVRGRGGWERG